MSGKCIFRSRPERDYTTMPNTTARDKNLSFKARGLLLMVMSHSDEWVIHQGWLATQASEGREAIRGAMKELEQHGYVVHELAREAGVIVGSRWSFYDSPRPKNQRTNWTNWDRAPKDGKPSDGKPPYGKPSDGKPSPLEDNETEDQKTEGEEPSGKLKKEEVVEEKEKKGKALFEEFKTYWNTTLGTLLPEIRLYSDKRAKAFATRMMNPDWVTHWKEAIDKIPSCPFLIGENDRKWKADAEFFLRPDTVAKIIEGKYDGPQEDPNNWWRKHY